LAATPCLAQKVIEGSVTDAQTGETLPLANITIEGTYRGTITNEDGSFSMSIPDSLLPATLRIRYIGYHTYSHTISPQTGSQLEIALDPSVTEMDALIVTDENPGERIMRE